MRLLFAQTETPAAEGLAARLESALAPAWPFLTAPLFWAVLLAATAFWILLVRQHQTGRRVGVALGLVSLVFWAAGAPLAADMANASLYLFWLLAGMALVSAAATVTSRSPVYCALWFALMLLATAGLFLLQGAQFVGVATVAVYAGAIVVMFLFVLMLAQPEGRAYYDRISWGWAAPVAAALVGVGLASSVVRLSDATSVSLRERVLAAAPELAGSGEQRLLTDVRLETTPRSGQFTLTLFINDDPAVWSARQGELTSRLATQALGIDEAALELRLLRAEPLAVHHMARLGGEMFSVHLISVEVAGTLLLAALVGAVAIVIRGKDIQNEDVQNDETSAGPGSDAS